MEGFSSKIRETSRQLTAKERVRFKDTTDAIRLDEATRNGSVIIYPDMWGILDIHNEHSDDKDYVQYIIIGKDGEKYVTGSKSLWSSFMDIAADMEGEEEEWGIKVYRVPSKNYQGRDFITCSIE